MRNWESEWKEVIRASCMVCQHFATCPDSKPMHNCAKFVLSKGMKDLVEVVM